MATKKEKPLAERFAEAKGRVEHLTKRPTNDQLLDLYAFYKQATAGDVAGSRPGLLDLKGRGEVDARVEGEGAGGGREVLAGNRHELSRMLDTSPGAFRHFCYPSGVHAPEVYPALEAAGVRSATTTDFGLNPPGGGRFALKRILDCQSMSELELEARLSGFWSLIQRGRRAVSR